MKIRFFKRNKQPTQTAPVITLSHTEQFHKQKHKIGGIIISVTDDHEILYGARALNVRFPKHLDRHTKDFDIMTKTPRKDAREAEQKLDKSFGGDFFYIEPAKHKGTVKVIAHATGETYADYTKPDKKVPFDIINGIKYAKLSFMKETFKKSLNDPFSAHRHAKDIDGLNRIKIYEKSQRKVF